MASRCFGLSPGPNARVGALARRRVSASRRRVGARQRVGAAAQELAILRVWPFESVCVDVFNIENQPPHGEASILRPLQARRGAASG